MIAELELRALEQQCACLAALGRIPELEKLLERRSQPCVRYYLALAYARSGDIDRAAEQVTLALARHPDHAGLRALELRLQAALPAAYLQANARRKAAEIWERALAADPGDFAALHNLAILTYWWAQQEESVSGRGVNQLWTAAIVYWTRLATSDSFWSAWRAELSRRWGVELQDSDLQPVRETLLDERLMRVFEDYISRYKERGRFEEAARHDSYITAAMLEKRPHDSFTGELGKILVLIDERGQPEKGLERLAALPENIRQGPEAGYLRVRALLESARRLRVKRLPAEALRQAEAAWAEAAALPPQWAAIQQEAGEMLDSLGKQEAARLQQEERLDEAIDLVERLNIRDYACVFHCDRGLQRLSENRFEDGRADFQRALEFDPEYLRAKKAMGAAYYNEANSTEKPDVKIKLLQKSLEYQPRDPATREDLGAAFHEKALRIVKEATPSSAKLDLARAIGLLRAAATTLNQSITEEALDAIVRTGDCSEEEKKGASGPCRTVLENLAYVARHRRQGVSE
jgi:tetratricopeptide (TPR) repeat protein